MAIYIPSNLYSNANIPLDSKYGPWASTSAAINQTTGIPTGARYLGLTVGILQNDGSIKDYWWKNGIADNNLEEKVTGGTGNNPMTTLGDTIYGGNSPAGSETRLAGNTTTTKKFLTQTGNGTISAAPLWDTVSKSDVGLGNVENTALSSWGGSSVINTLGIITNGTWNGTAISTTYGGTGLTSLGTASQMLRVNSGATALEYFTPTYLTPSSTLTAANLSGTIPSAVLGNSSLYIGTTSVALNRASGALSLTGVSIDGSAGSVGSSLTFNNGGSGDASGATFNGSVAKTISWNTVGASKAITLTVTGNSGDATFNPTTGALNIPNYTTSNSTTANLFNYYNFI